MHMEVRLGDDWRRLGCWNDFPRIKIWWIKSNLLFPTENDGKHNKKSNKAHIKKGRELKRKLILKHGLEMTLITCKLINALKSTYKLNRN